MNQPSDINDRGENGSLQRLIYLSARTSTSDEWSQLNHMAHVMLDKLVNDCPDTQLSLLVNALCVATSKVRDFQNAVGRLIDDVGV